MAILNKQQYNYRRESAAKRNIYNEQIAIEHGMTEEQAELISKLCSLRHELHSSIDSLVKSDEGSKKQELIEINCKIFDSGLEPMNFIGTDSSDFVDIDDIESMREYDDIPESDTDEYQQWYNENYERIYKELETLNRNIESYLSDIDTKYNTNFAPSGALRIM